MAHHDLKIHEQPFNDLLSGVKTCEVRNNDRGFQVGDTVQLHEIADTFTGRVMVRKITHVQTGYGLPDGLCVLSYAQLPSQGGEAVEVFTTWHHDSRSYEEQIVRHDNKGSRKALGAINAKLRAKVGRLERELATVKQSLTVEPVAYAAFADNGNIRMWCRSAIGMCELFDAHGNKAVPLYTHPADQVADDLTMVKVSRELLYAITDPSIHGYDAVVTAIERLRALLNGGRA